MVSTIFAAVSFISAILNPVSNDTKKDVIEIKQATIKVYVCDNDKHFHTSADCIKGKKNIKCVTLSQALNMGKTLCHSHQHTK